MTTKIEFINEFELQAYDKISINKLLTTCFPDTNYNGRIYFKQMPHYRLLMKTEDKLIGQVAVDYRTMNLNHELVAVFGLVDLAIHPNFQRKGLGSKLVKALEQIASKNQHNIDFLFLVTDQSLFYERLGFIKTKQHLTWLKIDQGKNYGLGNENIDDCFLMYKNIGDKNWEDGELDMLGYWY